MIVITAPTGDIGSQVVDRLLEAGEELRLVVRDPSRLDPEVRERVEIVAGSHGDAEVIDRACEGADAVFWLTPNLEDAPTLDASFAGFAKPACEAFARRGVARAVGISAIGRGTSVADEAGYVAASLAMDDEIAASGVAYRAVVNPSFMDNLLNQAGTIAEKDAFFGTIDPDRKLPTVATRDIAAVAADLLRDEGWTGTGEVPCLGPEDISMDEMAATISAVLGREITYTQIPGQAFKDRMVSFGMSEAMAQGMVDMFEAKNRGLDNGVRRTAESATPTTFRQWCEDTLAPAVAAASA